MFCPSEDDEVFDLKKKNSNLEKKLQEKEKEIKHLKLVISNLKGTKYKIQMHRVFLIQMYRQHQFYAGVCTTEYHTIFYLPYFLSQVYITVFFLPVGCCS